MRSGAPRVAPENARRNTSTAGVSGRAEPAAGARGRLRRKALSASRAILGPDSPADFARARGQPVGELDPNQVARGQPWSLADGEPLDQLAEQGLVPDQEQMPVDAPDFGQGREHFVGRTLRGQRPHHLGRQVGGREPEHDAGGVARAHERARERVAGAPAQAQEMAPEAFEVALAAGREPTGRVPAFGRGQGIAMTQEIEHERHEPSVDPCRSLSRRDALADAAQDHIPPLLAGAASGGAAISTVIMNPFVPLNSNASGPRR